ncbi:hypothetical protein GCM10011332_25230 [Terasakiella brassicae]|uniref:Uncharacterized protein n=1 Tax=Terasakiella brassicae TaxID=1634917 RepID=A0A917C3N4_9PROT|nr:hypothetical protein [Terasakiella brassicae]GGF70194.1 hypothetical protein GCM10011332_25230 [Terasakiella brassicae]
MFESLQKILLNKAMGKTDKKKNRQANEKNKHSQENDLRTVSGIALDDAIQKLESSGEKMDDLLAKNEDLLAQVKAEAAKKMTPERRALIESAQKVRKAKAQILEDLDDETRAKLYLTAIRAFTGRN